jgi:hypothetical protein
MQRAARHYFDQDTRNSGHNEALVVIYVPMLYLTAGPADNTGASRFDISSSAAYS